MNQFDDQALAAAQRFYGTHQGEHLSHDQHRLVERCTQHLFETLGLPHRRALDAARQAWSELQNAGCSAYIDLERSSSQMVVLQDPARRTEHVFTAIDLLRLTLPHRRRSAG